MQKSHRPIFPAPTSNSPQTGSPLQGPDDEGGNEPLPKRRRRCVRIACNHCRVKKMACDATRPRCARCRRLNITCEYISTNADETPATALKNQLQYLREDLKQHADILEHLQSVPEHEAIAVIRRLRSTLNVSNVLASIKGCANTAARPSEVETARAILPRTESGVEFELSLLHHSVYPPLEPLCLNSVDFEILFPQFPRRRSLTPEPPIRTSSIELSESVIDPVLTVAPPFPLRGFSSRRTSPVAGPLPDRQYIDSRLSRIDIGYWTRIPISNEFAACVLSHYFETYHPIIGCLDADLFLCGLVDHRLDNCSAFLLSALMSFACQSYSAFDVRSSAFGVAFLEEAQNFWRADRTSETLSSLSARCYLSIAATMSGRENLRAPLVKEIRDIAIKLKLFDVRATEELVLAFHKLPTQEVRQLAHVAWGTYAWLTFQNTHFEGEPVEFPPYLPIPGDSNRENLGSFSVVWPPHVLPSYMGQTFPTLCRFWVILQNINAMFVLTGSTPSIRRVALAVAEDKYQELLAWAKALPPEMFRDDYNPSHVIFFHGLYHCTVLTIFRSFVESDQRLQLNSFSSRDSTPSAVFSASLRQLKHLLYNYLAQKSHRTICGFFNGVVLQVSKALLKNPTKDPYWKFHFRLCFQFWKEAYMCYRIFFPILQGTLAIALQSGAIDSIEAKAMIEEFRILGRHHDAPEGAVTSAILDFGLATSNPQGATIDAISKQFDELMMFDELISGDF